MPPGPALQGVAFVCGEVIGTVGRPRRAKANSSRQGSLHDRTRPAQKFPIAEILGETALTGPKVERRSLSDLPVLIGSR